MIFYCHKPYSLIKSIFFRVFAFFFSFFFLNPWLFALSLFLTFILSCFYFFFLTIDLNILIPAVIAQIFSPIAKLEIPIVIPSKEVKAEIETHPVIPSINFALFLQQNNLYFQSKSLPYVFDILYLK